MRLGWKVLVPVGLANLALTAIALVGRGGPV
jgi:NADH:ubiquinone oxidoreductase subunit H